MKMIRVIVADDHNVMRESLRCFLDSTVNITVVGEACNGYEALGLTQKLTPEVLVLDMEMPGLTGLEVIQRLHAAESLVVGAAGYLVKGITSPDSIAEAIKNIARGERSDMGHNNPVRKPVADLKSQIKPIMQPM